ncbi:MAG: glycosyltransferase family 1 protein [Nitrospirota bacterium]
MKIVINAIPLLSPLTGVGNYTYNLITEFRKLKQDFDYTYYYGYFTRKLKFYSGESEMFYRIKESIKKLPLVSSYARNLKSRLAHLQLKNYDIYFEPNFIPLNIKARKTVTTVYDFSFYRYPEWHPVDRVEYFSKNFFKRIKKSDVIITISKYVEKEALEILKIRDTKVMTVYPGYNAVFSTVENNRIKNRLDNYILFVGSIEPRKNLIGLLNAYLLLPEYIKRDFKLLLVGFKGWGNSEILGLLNKLRGNVEYLGYVDTEELTNLYRGASCFAYPSLYEGFGLPPLEAMACGCPVVVSNVASLPEVCGDAACYVDPYNVENIAEGIRKVLTDKTLKLSLIEKGLERAKLFSWEKSAKEYIKVFEEISG